MIVTNVYTDGSCPRRRARRGEALQVLFEIVGTKTDSCIDWPFTKYGDGRGSVFYEGRMQIVPRVVCRLAHGEPPTPKHQAAHSCENGHLGCCNPSHVRWKTQSENCMESSRRSGGSNKGESNKASKLTSRQVRAIRKSKKTYRWLAERYGVCRNTIGNIKRRANWVHL